MPTIFDKDKYILTTAVRLNVLHFAFTFRQENSILA